MSKRVRLLKVQLQVTAVIDDGESLTEAPTQPVTLTPAQWADAQEMVSASLADLQERVNTAD